MDLDPTDEGLLGKKWGILISMQKDKSTPVHDAGGESIFGLLHMCESRALGSSQNP